MVRKQSAKTDDSPYCNIFKYYRGHNETDKTLENNVTKALINVLKYSGESVQQDFVSWLGKRTGIGLQPAGIIDTFLFPRRRDLPNPQIRVMLGIKPYWASWTSRAARGQPDRGERRYDGALLGGDWLVAIESKLYDGMDPGQFKAERRQLGRNAVKREITWRQIHGFLRQLNTTQKPTVEFLTSQFCEYLEMIDQVGFEGFREEHFGRITSDGTWLKEKDDIRDELRGVMNTLAGDLYEFGFAEGGMLKTLYPEWDRVKGLSKRRKEYDWAYVTFFPKRTNSPKWAHQCVLLDLGGQTLHVKAEVTTQEGARKLRSKLCSDEGKKELATILQGVQGRCAPIWFNPYRGDTGYGGELNPTTTLEELKGHVDGLWHELNNHKGRKYLKFELRKQFIKEQIIGTGADLVTEIASTMKSLHPFVQFVNSRSV